MRKKSHISSVSQIKSLCLMMFDGQIMFDPRFWWVNHDKSWFTSLFYDIYTTFWCATSSLNPPFSSQVRPPSQPPSMQRGAKLGLRELRLCRLHARLHGVDARMQLVHQRVDHEAAIASIGALVGGKGDGVGCCWWFLPSGYLMLFNSLPWKITIFSNFNR